MRILNLCLLAVTIASHALAADPSESDWLVSQRDARALRTISEDGHTVSITNSLVTRTFRVAPNAATVGIRNEMTGANILRGVKPEALIGIDGTVYAVGGLAGQPDYAYLDPAWLDSMTSNPESFQYVSHESGIPEANYPWKPTRNAPDAAWPPRGVTFTLHFAPPASLAAKYPGVRVAVHYALYDGVPVIAKWISITNDASMPVTIQSLTCEQLAVTESEKPRLHVESDYAFADMITTTWGPDADYLTQVDYEYRMPLLMSSAYPLGPGVTLNKGESFESFRTFELLYDSDDRERQGLVRRRMMRTLAPQAMENPIFMHVRESSSEALRLAIDQCAEVGFEMVIMTFGSGFDIESEDPAYIARMKADIDYAHGKGIEIGGYTLTAASRDVGDADNCIDPKTDKPGSKFGQSACLASAWGDGYFRRVWNFVDATGLDMIETDGPYHGDVCASTSHPHHRWLDDSQIAQWRAYNEFCRQARERGVFINSPDNYFFSGINKTAMGYRETNFSLPRWRQILIARQNIYDATFEKTPSMGWMFVPLVEYHGGGEAATFEPLSEHLPEYEWHLAQNFGSGVQACYRGPRLFDTDVTKAVVKKWVDFYKAHRDILNSDLIHVRRADGQDIDCMMHINPTLPERALAMVYNPTDREITTTIRLPLY